MDQILPYILIADDDSDDLLLFSTEFLESFPRVHIETAGDGDEALDFLSARRDALPEMIILDYKMPRVSGADVLRHLSADGRYQHIPVVVWTTSERENEMNECLQLGATRLFVKPTSEKYLKQIVGQIADILKARLKDEARGL